MAINIIQAARASSPYPWVKFWKWALTNGYPPDEIQTIIENGIVPEIRVCGPAIPTEMTFKLDESVEYPGLPHPDNLVKDIDGFEPTLKQIGGIS